MRKRCGRCGKKRLIKFFNKRRGNQFHSYCRDCHQAANRIHYLNNKQAHLEKAYKRRAYLRQQLTMAEVVSLVHRYDEGALSNDALLATAAPGIADILLFMPWGAR